MPPFGLSFDGEVFSKSFKGLRAKRAVHDFIAAMELAPADLLYLINNDKSLLDYVSRDNLPPPGEYSKLFSDDEILSWLPSQFMDVVERHPKGKEWAKKQVAELRRLL